MSPYLLVDGPDPVEATATLEEANKVRADREAGGQALRVREVSWGKLYREAGFPATRGSAVEAQTDVLAAYNARREAERCSS